LYIVSDLPLLFRKAKMYVIYLPQGKEDDAYGKD